MPGLHIRAWRGEYVVGSLVIRLAVSLPIRGARLGSQIDSRVPASDEARAANPVFTQYIVELCAFIN